MGLCTIVNILGDFSGANTKEAMERSGREVSKGMSKVSLATERIPVTESFWTLCQGVTLHSYGNGQLLLGFKTGKTSPV
jgi:hypothetical protein